MLTNDFNYIIYSSELSKNFKRGVYGINHRNTHSNNHQYSRYHFCQQPHTSNVIGHDLRRNGHAMGYSNPYAYYPQGYLHHQQHQGTQVLPGFHYGLIETPYMGWDGSNQHGYGYNSYGIHANQGPGHNMNSHGMNGHGMNNMQLHRNHSHGQYDSPISDK
jgi:hypothetical protein